MCSRQVGLWWMYGRNSVFFGQKSPYVSCQRRVHRHANAVVHAVKILVNIGLENGVPVADLNTQARPARGFPVGVRTHLQRDEKAALRPVDLDVLPEGMGNGVGHTAAYLHRETDHPVPIVGDIHPILSVYKPQIGTGVVVEVNQLGGVAVPVDQAQVRGVAQPVVTEGKLMPLVAELNARVYTPDVYVLAFEKRVPKVEIKGKGGFCPARTQRVGR